MLRVHPAGWHAAVLLSGALLVTLSVLHQQCFMDFEADYLPQGAAHCVVLLAPQFTDYTC